MLTVASTRATDDNLALKGLWSGHVTHLNFDKQVRPSSWTDLYPHIPILLPHSAGFYERRISAVMFTCGWAWLARYPVRLILGFWGAKFTKMRFPALDADEPPCKI